MDAIKEFIRVLIRSPYESSKSDRLRFFEHPCEMMNAFRSSTHAKLDDADKSAIMTLDHRYLAEYVRDAVLAAELADFARHNDTDVKWPKWGSSDWNPWENGRRCRPEGYRGDYHARWSGPQAGVKYMFRTRAHQGETFALRISGEGLLPEATMSLRPQTDGKPSFTAVADDFIPCNIRRSYLSATFIIPDDAWCGEYDLTVSNKANSKKPPMDGPLTFTITGNDCGP